MQLNNLQTANVLIAQSLDKAIYRFIREQFTNRRLLIDISIQEQIDAYNQYGQHKIDFSKIYDIGETHGQQSKIVDG